VTVAARPPRAPMRRAVHASSLARRTAALALGAAVVVGALAGAGRPAAARAALRVTDAAGRVVALDARPGASWSSATAPS